LNVAIDSIELRNADSSLKIGPSFDCSTNEQGSATATREN